MYLTTQLQMQNLNVCVLRWWKDTIFPTRDRSRGGSVGLLKHLFWQELFNFHGHFGENWEIHLFLLRIVQNEPLSEIQYPALSNIKPRIYCYNSECNYPCIIELPHDKTNKMACAPSEDSYQPGHPPSLIRVLAFRMKKAWVSYPLSTQRRLWSDWVDAQADRSLRWAHIPLCWFCHVAAQLLMLCQMTSFFSQQLRNKRKTTECDI